VKDCVLAKIPENIQGIYDRTNWHLQLNITTAQFVYCKLNMPWESPLYSH